MTLSKFLIVTQILAAYRSQIIFCQATSAERAVGRARRRRCHVAATAMKKPKMRIWSMRPPRMMFSPFLKEDAVLATVRMPAPPPWMQLGLRWLELGRCAVLSLGKKGGKG